MTRAARVLPPRRASRAAAVLAAASILGALGCSEPEDETLPLGPQGVPESGLEAPSEEGRNPHAAAGPTAIRFDDVSEACGISTVNHSGREGVKEYLPEAVGTGPSWLDFDGDGWLDLYVPDGDVYSNYVRKEEVDPASGARGVRLVPKSPRPERFRDQLWRNRGDGTFEDVAERAGVADENWSFGSTAADFDGDGWTDLFVANFGACRLYRNNGDGSFTDVAPSVGLAEATAQGRWNTCGAVGDYDGDGRLDLYVAAYSDIAAEVERQRIERQLPEGTPVEAISGRSCRWKAIRAYCGPLGLVAQPDLLFRGMADGTYLDVTDAVGLRPREAKYAFTSLFYDVNDDGLPDVYVANDSVENFFWQQERDAEGRVRFRDTSDILGVKYGQQLNAQASMGAAVADVNRDGIFDLFVTNFSHDYNNVYVGHRAKGSAGGFYFRDRGLQVMGQAVYYDLSWGCGWYDFDNDRDLDLYVANGHVYKEIDLFEKTGTPYDQWNAIFECLEAETLKYREIGPKAKVPAGVNPADLDAGSGAQAKKCSRGAAFGDFDNDGFVDVFVQNMNAAPTLIRNAAAPGADRRWVKIGLRQPGRNRDALGAKVRVTAGGVTQTFPVLRVTSFLGCDDPRLPVGLGSAETCDVEVTWPPTGEAGGERATTRFEGLAAGSWWILDRATGKAEKGPLPRAR
jgi:hypothetical protein